MNHMIVYVLSDIIISPFTGISDLLGKRDASGAFSQLDGYKAWDNTDTNRNHIYVSAHSVL